jgi:hypothetical protein
MAVLNGDEYKSTIEKIVGDDLSDENLKIMEDLTDTYESLQSQIRENGDYKTKYEENDKAWREKYASRFMEGGTNSEENEEPPEQTKTYRYEDLFTTE